MADLAKQADDHIPELVAAFRTGKGENEASTVLRLMQSRAVLAVPALLELAGDPDPSVRNRGLAALDIAFDAASATKATCGAG
jgi:hypothetical protein